MTLSLLLATAQRAVLCLRSLAPQSTARWDVAKKEFALVAAVVCSTVGIAAADEVLTTDGRVLTGDFRFKGSDFRIDHHDPLPAKDWFDARFTKPAYHPMTTGIVLADGSVVAGQITAMDDHGVTIQPVDGDSMVIATGTISRVQFAAIDESRLKALPEGQVTGLLNDGDTFAGTVQSFDVKTVTMDSVVLGPTTFAVGTKIAAIVYRPAGRLDGDLRITLADGTRVAADKFEATDSSHFKIAAHGIGDMRFPADRLVEITKKAAGAVDAADQRPTEIDGGPAEKVYAVDTATSGLSTRIVGPPAGRVICVADGSVTLAVPDGCDFFTARAAVPADSVPSDLVKFSVIVDGESAESATRFSVDDPSTLMVSVAGHRSVKLKVESATAGHSASAVGLWVDPVFLKHVDRPKPVVPTTVPTTGPTTEKL
jgi:hypothetical protein